jgi:uncharacterized protein (TIGR02594 family)
MASLPSKYQWIHKIGTLPLLVQEYLKIHGVKEVAGTPSNPEIIRWAKVLGLQNVYTNDGIAWCGLTMAYLCHKTDKPIVKDPLWALNWLKWGDPVPKGQEMFGDILVFKRYNHAGKLIGGHVGLYIAEDADEFMVGGGNTGDEVKIAPLSKTRLAGARRWKYINMPASVKKYNIENCEPASTNEA